MQSLSIHSKGVGSDKKRAVCRRNHFHPRHAPGGNYLDTQEGETGTPVRALHSKNWNSKAGRLRPVMPLTQRLFIPKNRSRRSVTRHLAVCSFQRVLKAVLR